MLNKLIENSFNLRRMLDLLTPLNKIRITIGNNFRVVILQQFINPKRIPVIIINFNQLDSLKKLINWLLIHKYENIHIIDNNSNYKDLLSFYTEIKEKVNIIYNSRNNGHKVFWENAEINKNFRGYYIVTDPDVIPVDECPDNFVSYFLKLLRKNRQVLKVGFSLKIDDIPENYPHKGKVIKWESKFWENKTADGNYLADIDTTFALYRPFNLLSYYNFYSGIRTNFPFQARHLGWYHDLDNLSVEMQNYYLTSNNSSSWKSDILGNLVNEKYKSI